MKTLSNFLDHITGLLACLVRWNNHALRFYCDEISYTANMMDVFSSYMTTLTKAIQWLMD